MSFCADSTGHLATIENYAPDQIITFGGLEYTTDSRGELVLSGWTPGRISDLANTRGSTSKRISSEDHESCLPTPPGATEELPSPSSNNPVAVPDSDVDQSSAWDTKSGLEPIPAADLESTPLPRTTENASGMPLRVDPAYG
jgi:hypothetical protein